MKHNGNWSNEFNYEGFENNTINNDKILGDAHEALTCFYQKETRRSKTLKQKKHCWQ